MTTCNATLTVDGRKVLVAMTGGTKCARNIARLSVMGEIERIDHVRAVHKEAENSGLEIVLTDREYVDSALTEITTLFKEHRIHVHLAAVAA